MSELKVHVKKIIQAPIEKVFDAWLQADTLAQFMLPMPGMPFPKTRVDAKVGGRFECLMMVGEEELAHRGEYLEIDRPHKLIFTWESPFSIDGSTVSITCKKLDETMTEIELLHRVFKDEETRCNHENGWTNILQVLAVMSEAATA